MKHGNWDFIDSEKLILSNKPGMVIQEMLTDTHGRIKDLEISTDPNFENK
jgi:hypothetical protein